MNGATTCFFFTTILVYLWYLWYTNKIFCLHTAQWTTHSQDFGVDSFHLDDELQGVVRFIGIAKPIVAAHVSYLTTTVCSIWHLTVPMTTLHIRVTCWKFVGVSRFVFMMFFSCN